MVRLASIALLSSTAAAIGLAIVYVAGGQAQWEGTLLAISLGGIGVALGLWGRDLAAGHESVEERPVLRSRRESRQEFEQSLERGERALGRRTVLLRLFAAAGAALGIAALFPIRSLGPSPRGALRRTAWRAGSRATVDGRPVRAADLARGTVLTVFPEGSERPEDSATLLIRVDPELLELPPERADWAPDGIVAYSKICTHVGCPVGLYRETTHELLCPCHQSTFDVLRGAKPVFGPATRSLPQLPIEIDEDGVIVARSDYTEPIGPSFWNRER
ncbi:MAG TPA: Rieske (2Fe-2S) protein [Acidimicrobiales bacterium]